MNRNLDLEKTNEVFFKILNLLSNNGFRYCESEYSEVGNTEILFYHKRYRIINDLDEEGEGDGYKLIE